MLPSLYQLTFLIFATIMLSNFDISDLAKKRHTPSPNTTRETESGIERFGKNTPLAETPLTDTPFAEICRAELESLAPESPEYVVAKFKLTNALRFSNLPAAYASATESLQLAKKIEDPDFLVVALAQVNVIDCLINGNGEDRKSPLDSFELTLSENASAELVYFYNSAMLDLVFWTSRFDVSTTEFLRPLQDASRLLDDDLLIQLQSQEFYTYLFWQFENFSDDKKSDLTKSLESASRDYLDAKTLLEMAKMIDGANPKKTQLKHGLAAVTEAELTGNQFLIYKTQLSTANIYWQLNDLEKAKQHYQLANRAANYLKAQFLIYEAKSHLARTERRLGNSQSELALLEQIEQSAVFADLSYATKNNIFRALCLLHQSLGNETDAENYKSRIMPRGAVTEIHKLTQQAKAHQELRLAEKQESLNEIDSLYKQQQLTDAKWKAKLDWLRAYGMAITLVAVSLAMLSAIIFIRKRLVMVKKLLVNERENIRQSRQQCADLTHRLNRAQRMESLGLMAGSVAHDFNNILVGVLGNAEVLQMKNENSDGEFRIARINSIINSAEKAASLSKQMLAYAGKQKIERHALDLNEAVLQYESILSSVCEKHKLVFELPEKSPPVSKVDLTQIEQALLNLVTNATEASPAGSPITIKTGHESIQSVETDNRLYGTRSQGGEFCFIEVTDQGTGIAEVEMDRIFEPFFTNSDSNSRGLGLSVVYGVVQSHDGLIRCSSKIGIGTTFRILLPMSVEEIQQPIDPSSDSGFHLQPPFSGSEPSYKEPSYKEAHYNILVIDDEESVIELCEQALGLNGWNVRSALGGVAGFEKIKRHADKISCVLLDVMMPEMGANELIRELEALRIDVPIVLMSGFSQTKIEFFLEKPQVVTIIQKPFRLIELQEAVEQAVRTRITG